ncbi:MAG: hypothetical protein NC816_00710 [Candidatus Omnitrophica bacterium]|nr:hypothetical protein [Candidatus Omnitrophota bacterium]
MNKNEKKELVELIKVLNSKDFDDIQKAEYVDNAEFVDNIVYPIKKIKDILQQKEYNDLKYFFAELISKAVDYAVCEYEDEYLKHIQIAKFVLKLIKKYVYNNKKIDITNDFNFVKLLEEALLNAYSQVKDKNDLYYIYNNTHVAIATRKIRHLLKQIFTKNNVKVLEQNKNSFSVYFFRLLNEIFDKYIISYDIIKEMHSRIMKKKNSIIDKQVKFDEEEQKYVVIEQIIVDYTDVFDEYYEEMKERYEGFNYACKYDDELKCYVIVETIKRDATKEEIKEVELNAANKS